MKKIFPFSILLVLIISSCGVTPQEASEYNVKVVGAQGDVVSKVDDLEKAFNNFDSEEIEFTLGKAIEQTKMSIRNLKRIKCIDEDSFLHKAAKTFFDIYLETLNNEYKKMNALYALPDEEFDLEIQKEFKNLSKEKNTKLRKAFSDFSAVQEEFAIKYKVKLVEKEDL